MLSLFLDESEQGKFLGVGGYYTQLDQLLDLELAWRQLKVDMGLMEKDEIKWTLPSDHPARRRLNDIQRTTKELNERAIALISERDLTIIVVVMVEQRKRSLYMNIFRKKLIPRHFYCEAFKYVLQRISEEAFDIRVQNTTETLPLFCVIDRPGLSKKCGEADDSLLEGTSIRLGENAPLEQYQEGFFDGIGEGPRKRGNLPLKSLNFHSSLLEGSGRFSDALQIADLIIGCVTSWVADTHKGNLDPWLLDQIRRIHTRFRGGTINMFGDGFIIWPWENELWNTLQRSLK